MAAEFAEQCIDASAPLHVSHGAPRLHGIELYRNRPIFYDLGNLIFQTATQDGFYDDPVWGSVVAECRFVGGSFREMTLTPIRLRADIAGPVGVVTRRLPSIARRAKGRGILRRLAELSRPFGTVVELVGETAMVRAVETSSRPEIR
jgi:poly-gamma-glutamate capsule biosynthesis protein CapA/YwtB (metallophosphatase superfamily)